MSRHFSQETHFLCILPVLPLIAQLRNLVAHPVGNWSKRVNAGQSELMQTQEDTMSKEQLLQELAEAFEKLIKTATEAAQRGVTPKGDRWGPREIVAHLAGWEVMAT